LKRSVAFVAFDAEESGLIGSDYFLSDNSLSPENIKPRFSAYMMGGGYYSGHFAGKAGGIALDFNNQYRDQEFGLSWGIGIEMMNLQIGLTSYYSMDNLYPNNNETVAMRVSCMVTLGWRF